VKSRKPPFVRHVDKNAYKILVVKSLGKRSLEREREREREREKIV
jgi:hypothetical protein